jgi:hypothetical protein
VRSPTLMTGRVEYRHGNHRARQALIFLVCSRIVPQFEGAARLQSYVSSHLQGDFRVAAKAKVLLLLREEVFEVPGAAARGREQEVQPVTVVDLFRADARPSITDRGISQFMGNKTSEKGVLGKKPRGIEILRTAITPLSTPGPEVLSIYRV